MQTITLLGNLTSDAEVKSGNDNSEYIAFRVACNEGNGDSKTTSYYDVTCRKSGILDYLKSGQKVAVQGKLRASARLSDKGEVFLNLNVSAFMVELAGSAKN